jgi:hypothetical protein
MIINLISTRQIVGPSPVHVTLNHAPNVTLYVLQGTVG